MIIHYLKLLKKYFTKVTSLADTKLLKAVPAGRFISLVYYLIRCSVFLNEFNAVYSGRKQFEKNADTPDVTSALLRRNIHRLEKGMIMKNRRSVFAIEYINETVDIYQKCKATTNFDQSELKWGSDVLKYYFEIVDETREILKAKNKFEVLDVSKAVYDEISNIPYIVDRTLPCGIDYDRFLQLCEKRVSVRWYIDKQVKKAVVENAVSAALQAPSACNRQSFHFYYSTNAEKSAKIAKCAGGTSGFHHNVCNIVVVVGDLSGYKNERDRHIIYIDAGLASMQFMLALQTQGIATCAINWPDITVSEKRIKKLVPLKQYEKVIMLIAFGEADSDSLVPYSKKRSLESVVSEL